MRRPIPRNPDCLKARRNRVIRASALASGLLALGFAAPLRAMDAAEWKNRQSLAVDRAGVIKIVLPGSTLDAARTGMEDLRLIDPSGGETPFLIERAAPTVPAAFAVPRSFRDVIVNTETQLLIETGTGVPLASIALVTPAPNFLKAARIEISSDGARWETLEAGALLFRQFGAEQLRLDLGRRTASQVRITISDARTAPVPFTGARLALAVAALPAPSVPLAGVRVTRRDEFNGESVLTLDLGASHVPLASLEFVTGETLFARPVSIAVREMRDDTAVERAVATDSIYRIAAEGLPSRAKLEVPLEFTPLARELLVHVVNGDSPPLAIETIRAQQRPVWIVFRAAAPGSYALLTGNPDAAAPRYDLASFAATLRETAPTGLAPEAIESNPGYRRRDSLADTPLLGGPIDPAKWRYRKGVQLATGGVQQLELDLDVLAHAQAGFADLRLVRGGAQVPYLVERPVLSRATALVAVSANDPQQPRLSRWDVRLPRAGLPITQLTITSTTPLFQRHFRLFEKVSDERTGSYERTLAEGDWSKSPGNDRPLVLALGGVPSTDALVLETNNGDNPALALNPVRAAYPVTRLLFKTDAEPLALYYGNREAGAPRYDLALVAPQILASEKGIAMLAPEETTGSSGWSGLFLTGTRAGILFWVVLAGVVVALLVIVAKLLPKPPAPSA